MRNSHVKRRAILAAAVLGFTVAGAQAASVFWDADGDATTATGGAGTWDTTSSLWRPLTSTGTPLQTWANDGTEDAVFGGTAGTLSLGTNISANSVQFSSGDSYTLSSTTNTLTTGTIRNSSKAAQFVLANVLGVGGSLTIENNNTATGAAGATITHLQGMLSMSNGALTQLNIAGPTDGSYFKYNQVRLWNPLVSPFNPGVFDDGSRNAWNINTVINFTGDYAMLAGNTPDNGVSHAGSHNFLQPVHTNNSKVLLAASVGNTLSFKNTIDGNGDLIITTNDPTLPGAGQGAVSIDAPATYTGVTRIMNSINGTGGGGGSSFGTLRIGGTDFLPTTTRLIFGDTGFTTAGAFVLNGFNQTVASLESVPNINAIGVTNYVFGAAAPHNTLTINGALTSTYAAPIGLNAIGSPFSTGDGIALSFPATNTGSTTLTNGTSQYTDGTTISGGTVISRNAINNGTTSPVGKGPITVNGTSTSQFGSFGGTGQVPGAVTQNSFSHLQPGGPAAVDISNQLTLNGGLTLAGGSNVDVDFNGFGNDTVNTNALTLTGVDTGANRVLLNMFDLGAGVHNGTFPVLAYSSVTGGDLSNFLLNPPAGFNAAHFALQDSGSSINVVVTGEASDIVWSGAVNSNWDTGTPSTGTPNFNGTGGQTKFFAGDRVTFNDANSTYNVVVDAAGVAPATVSINANGNYTFSGGAVTSTVLSKAGNGSALIQNAQTYSGGTTVIGGTLAIDTAGSISGGPIAVNAGSTLALTAASNISGVSSLSFADATLRADGPISTDRPMTLSGTVGFTMDTQANDVTLSGVLTSTSAVPFKKSGSGTLLINTPTAMAGPVSVNAGTLALSLGTTGVSSGAITVNSGAAIDLRSTQAGYSAKTMTLNLSDNTTLKFSGESGILGGSGVVFSNTTFVDKNIYIQGADASSRLVTRNFLKNSFSEPDASTTVHLTGSGMMHIGSGSLSVSSTNAVFSGNWQLDSGFTGVLGVGPILNGNNTEVLVGLGYNPGFPAGPTNQVTVNGGTLAVGADARNGATGLANAATNISGAFRSPVILGGGNIASTGREYSSVTNTGDNFTGTGDANSDTPVTARFAADITLTDGTTSKVLLYDPIALENYDNSADPSALAQNTNPVGPRSVRIVTDFPTSNGTTPGRADVPSNFTWGNNSTLVVDSGTQAGGVLSFERVANSAGDHVSVGDNAALSIGAGSTVKLGGTVNPLMDGTRSVAVSIAGATDNWTGRLDMVDKDLVQHSTSGTRVADAARITNQLKQGANFSHAGQFWTGNGIVTSLGGNGSTSYTAIGVAVNDFALLGGAQTGALYSTFSGQNVGINDVLVKYTYFGDADLDGAVTTNDYFQIDNGFLGSKTGWINGDFDYDGAVTTNDYFLIDNAFLGQGAALVPAAVGSAEPLSGVTAVPEPASLGIFAFAAAAAIARRRRRNA